jgi:predicted permease
VNFYTRLWHGLQAMPGAKSAALMDTPPLTGFGGPSPFAAVGKPIPPLGEQPLALRHIATPNAFATLGIPITRGRDFDPNDTPASPAPLIVNETFAKAAFPGEDPIGRRVLTGMAQREMTIVGVVADTYTQNLTTPPRPEMWYSALARPERFQSLLIKTEGDPAAIAPSVREVLKRIDPGIALINPTTLAEIVEQSTADRRLTMALLAAFAALALILASLGVYSVMSYSVGQRAGEIGVRMAMGARPRDVQSLVVTQGLKLTGAGLALGAIAALVLTRLMATLLFGVGASDPVTYLGITVLLALVAVLACFVPARRAARVDPMVVVRECAAVVSNAALTPTARRSRSRPAHTRGSARPARAPSPSRR